MLLVALLLMILRHQNARKDSLQLTYNCVGDFLIQSNSCLYIFVIFTNIMTFFNSLTVKTDLFSLFPTSKAGFFGKICIKNLLIKLTLLLQPANK